MQIPIRYGKDDIIDLSVPEKNLLGVFNPNPVAKFDEAALIAKALANPINQKSFDELIAGDEMRAVHLKPYHDIQKAVDDALAQKGADAKIIILPFGSMTVPKV